MLKRENNNKNNFCTRNLCAAYKGAEVARDEQSMANNCLAIGPRVDDANRLEG